MTRPRPLSEVELFALLPDRTTDFRVLGSVSEHRDRTFTAPPPVFDFLGSQELTRKNEYFYRAVQRIESMRRSPIFTHLTSSVNGIVLIRAFDAEKLLVAEFDRVLNLHTSSYFTKLSLLRWFASTTMWITWGNLMIMTDKSEYQDYNLNVLIE